MFKTNLQKYDAIVALCPEIQRKGKSVPYTSANGHMYSLLNKEGELGFRFDKATQERYISEWKSDYLYSHGAQMKGYVKIPEAMLDQPEALVPYLRESLAYVESLDPK